jgi:long-subunit fatty acid transport protein
VLVATAFVNSFAYDWSIGGKVNYQNLTSKNKNSSKVADVKSYASIAPEVAYLFNDKIDFGVGIAYVSGDSDELLPFGDNSFLVSELETVRTYIFGEYLVASFGKMGIYIRGDMFYENGILKENGDVGTDARSYGYGVSVAPNLQYALSDRFTLSASLNFLRAGIEYYSYKTKTSGGSHDRYGNTNIYFDCDTNNFITSLGDITLGFSFNF